MAPSESAPNLSNKKKVNWKKFENSMVPKQSPKKEAVTIDWLAEQRMKKAETENNTV